jgi:uncharacterized protein YndB with AHSA1/START domain
MTQAQHDVLIARPVQDVFEFLADGRNNAQWQHLVVSTAQPDAPIGVGSVFRQRARHPLGFTVSADYRVSVYQPPRSLSLEVISGGPVRPTMTFDLAPRNDASTAVRCTVAFQARGLARLTRPALSLLHPVFAWEAGAIERIRPLLESPEARAA